MPPKKALLNANIYAEANNLASELLGFWVEAHSPVELAKQPTHNPFLAWWTAVWSEPLLRVCISPLKGDENLGRNSSEGAHEDINLLTILPSAPTSLAYRSRPKMATWIGTFSLRLWHANREYWRYCYKKASGATSHPRHTPRHQPRRCRQNQITQFLCL